MPTLIQQIAAGESPPFAPLSVEQYVQMAETGILPTTPRVELLDGLLVLKDRRDGEGNIMTVGPRHTLFGQRLFLHIHAKLARLGWHARHEQPIAIPPYQAPEPDVAVVRGPDTDYGHRLPEPADTAAVMEVSYSSLHTDRTTKLQRYAAAGIPVYWIVNLAEQCVEQYGDPIPSEARYNTHAIAGWTADLTLPLPDGQTIVVPLAHIFP